VPNPHQLGLSVSKCLPQRVQLGETLDAWREENVSGLALIFVHEDWRRILLRLLSFACRFNFCKASRFICSFICEYFLNTLASPCRSSWVTHSSATPPALRRVAYVERRS